MGAWPSIDIAAAQSKILELLGIDTFQSLRSVLVAQQLEYRCQLHIYQWLLLQQSILTSDISSTGPSLTLLMMILSSLTARPPLWCSQQEPHFLALQDVSV